MGRARAAFSVSESADKKMFATRNSGKLPVIRLSDFACARERKRERERERERGSAVTNFPFSARRVGACRFVAGNREQYITRACRSSQNKVAFL